MSRMALTFLAGCLAACVSSPEPAASRIPACVEAASLDGIAAALVRIDADLGSGSIICSGVAVANTLVLTGLGCVTRPSRWADPNPGDDLIFGNPAPRESFYGSIDYSRVCLNDSNWSPLEDGSTAGRYGKRVDPSALTVFRVGTERALQPRDVATSGASSRCADGLAVLIFDQALDVTPLPVRLEYVDTPNEETTLAGYCRSRPLETLTTRASHVVELSGSEGTDTIPPHSMRLPGDVTALSYGGAVVANNSGALIGIIASGLTERCTEEDPNATTIALRLSAFRRMLLEAASAAKVDLRIESGDAYDVSVPGCEAQTGRGAADGMDPL